MQKYNTSPPHFFRKALTKRRWCVIIVKSAKQFAHTACGILPCEQKKAENLTKVKQKQQTKSQTANYATVEDSPIGRAERVQPHHSTAF